MWAARIALVSENRWFQRAWDEEATVADNGAICRNLQDEGIYKCLPVNTLSSHSLKPDVNENVRWLPFISLRFCWFLSGKSLEERAVKAEDAKRRTKVKFRLFKVKHEGMASLVAVSVSETESDLGNKIKLIIGLSIEDNRTVPFSSAFR